MSLDDSRYGKPAAATAHDVETTPLLSYDATIVKSKLVQEQSKPNSGVMFMLTLLCVILTMTTGVAVWTTMHQHPVVHPPPMMALVEPLQHYHGMDTSLIMYPVVLKDDFGPYKEYSVIHTDRSLNLMSYPFQRVMRDLNELLKGTYNAEKVAIIPGSGTFGMEAVARQYATDEHVMVLRNGYFSYRWTEIFEMGGPPHRISTSHTVLKAQPVAGYSAQHDTLSRQYQPYPVHQVVERIRKEQPAVLFAPHVETSTGMILPDDYIRQVAEAVHDVGGLLVLDCIASGTVWIDMKDLGVDVLITAPQKGWTAHPCAALVQLSERAVQKMNDKEETSFSMSLKRWSAVMDAYEQGGFAYHTTPPTDALRVLQEVSVEMLEFGLPELKRAQIDMGQKARGLLDSKGLISAAAPGFQAPAVLVYYSPGHVDNLAMVERFHQQGLEIAKGVPWKIDEPEGLKTFRIGLFGLDKLENIDQTVAILGEAVDHVLADTEYNDVNAVPKDITKAPSSY